MRRPQPDEYPAFAQTYIDAVGGDVLSELIRQEQAYPDFVKSLDPALGDHSYAEGKWTLKEFLGHINDTERIMAYRALRIARNDMTPLPSFEQDDYVANARFAERTIESFAEEFAALRHANLFLIRSLNEEEIGRMGVSGNSPMSVRALLFILAGHVRHHWNILIERYGETGF